MTDDREQRTEVGKTRTEWRYQMICGKNKTLRISYYSILHRAP